MTSLHALIQTLDDWMKPELFKDYAPNGLQVEGRDTISRLALGVTASADVIQQAVAWGADALLVHQSDEKVVVPMTTFAIEDAICTWQNEKRGEHEMNPRLKREIFVMLKSENKYMWPRNAGQLNGDEVIHIILHMGRHYAYVNANGPVLNYYDSGNAATTTRNKKRNSNADTMMREVGEQLNKNTKKQFQYLNIVKESPKQTNDIDWCICPFFMECTCTTTRSNNN